MPQARSAASVFFGLLLVSTSLFAANLSVSAHADDYLYSNHSGDYILDGTVQSVSRADDRVTLLGTDNRRYLIDVYGADIVLGGSRRPGETADLARGMRVEVIGTLLGRTLVESRYVRVLPEFSSYSAPLPAEPVLLAPPISLAPPLPAEPLPAAPLPVELPPAPAQPQLNVDVSVRDVDTARAQATVLGDDDKRYTLDLQGTDIILLGSERMGTPADLSRGMRVRLVGVYLPSGNVEADRLRVLPLPEALPTPPAPIVPVVEDMSVYTGILIDGRLLPRLSRSPAPAIYGSLPDQTLLYPDRSHVPTPDEVQEESIVRYYHVEADAETGIAGPHPLILTALSVLGPADDAVQLSPEDAARFQALDKRLHFTRTWKVGFLIPSNQ